jgi:hypothetical protein
MRSGLKGRSRSSVTRRRSTTSTKAYTNAESHLSEGSICRCGGLEEEDEDEDEECEHPSQDRNMLGKRARKMAEVRRQKLPQNSRPLNPHTNCPFSSSKEL